MPIVLIVGSVYLRNTYIFTVYPIIIPCQQIIAINDTKARDENSNSTPQRRGTFHKHQGLKTGRKGKQNHR